MKNTTELYMSSNSFESVNTLCQLDKLNLLDISYNLIECLESIAALSILQKLTTVSIRGNPIDSREKVAEDIKNLIPKLRSINPADICALTEFSNLKSLAFSSLPDRRPPISVRMKTPLIKLSAKYNEKIESPLSKTIRIRDNPDSPYLDIDKETPKFLLNQNKNIETKRARPAPTPPKFFQEKPTTPTAKHRRSPIVDRPQSAKVPNTKINLYKTFSPSSTVTVSLISDRKFKDPMKFISEAENRVRNWASDLESSNSMSSLKIRNSSETPRKIYGNPQAALMIGPPAVNNAAYKPQKVEKRLKKRVQ